MFTIDIAISRPRAEVFEYIKDIERAPSWYSAVKRVHPIDSGSVDVGKRFLFEREIAGRTLENEVQVSELVEGKSIALESKAGPTPFTYRYSVSEEGSTTRVRLEGEITGEGGDFKAA